MKTGSGSQGEILFFILIAAILLTVSSCDKKLETIRKSDIESLPSQTVKEFTTTYTDSATKQLVMSSPLMERYTNRKEPYLEFRLGVKVVFYDGKKDPVGTLTSKYARYDENKKLWELKDSVIAVNERNEVMETELLYWDQDKELVYTDRFVRMTSEDQIVMGTGFQSDPRFMEWHIRNVSASFYINDVNK
jgi:LPS export ABC transporter protein LptC